MNVLNKVYKQKIVYRALVSDKLTFSNNNFIGKQILQSLSYFYA